MCDSSSDSDSDSVHSYVSDLEAEFDEERFALKAKIKDLRADNRDLEADIKDLEHQLSTLATSKLTEAIKMQLVTLPPEFDQQVKKDKGQVKELRDEFYADMHKGIVERLSTTGKRANETKKNGK